MHNIVYLQIQFHQQFDVRLFASNINTQNGTTQPNANNGNDPYRIRPKVVDIFQDEATHNILTQIDQIMSTDI